MMILPIIKLVIAVFLLFDISKIQLSTASQAKHVVTDTLPNVVEQTIESENTISTQRSSSLPKCQNVDVLKNIRECSFKNLFIQLVELKGQGSFGQVWKVTYSRSRFEGWWAHTNQRLAAIKFIQYSQLDISLAAKEIAILMKMHEDGVKHVTKIIPRLTTNMSTLDASFTANKAGSIKWVMIGMECYSMDLHMYSAKNARMANFDAHLLVSNLMVCSCQLILL